MYPNSSLFKSCVNLLFVWSYQLRKILLRKFYTTSILLHKENDKDTEIMTWPEQLSKDDKIIQSKRA